MNIPYPGINAPDERVTKNIARAQMFSHIRSVIVDAFMKYNIERRYMDVTYLDWVDEFLDHPRFQHFLTSLYFGSRHITLENFDRDEFVKVFKSSTRQDFDAYVEQYDRDPHETSRIETPLRFVNNVFKQRLLGPRGFVDDTVVTDSSVECVSQPKEDLKVNVLKKDHEAAVMEYCADKSFELVIYAPPYSGKTTFQKTHHKRLYPECKCENLHKESLFDTDDIRSWREHPKRILTNIPAVTQFGRRVLAFIPTIERFEFGCRKRGINVEPGQYKDWWHSALWTIRQKCSYIIYTNDFIREDRWFRIYETAQDSDDDDG